MSIPRPDSVGKIRKILVFEAVFHDPASDCTKLTLVFIEDENIQILEAFDKILGTKCFWGANTVPVLTGRGRDDKIPFQIKKTLHEWTGEDVEVHFIIDGDGMNETWRKLLSDYAIKNNIVLHQLIRHEIESYLLRPSRLLCKDEAVQGEIL